MSAAWVRMPVATLWLAMVLFVGTPGILLPAALAQPDAANPSGGAGEQPAAQAPDVPGAPQDTPTRRPTRPPAPTSTITMEPTGTETALIATPTEKPTVRARPTVTQTLQPAPTATATSAPLALPMNAASGTPLLIGGGLLALFAAWAGARIAGARERADRRRARRTLATAMLHELRRIDALLRRVVGIDNPSLPSLDHPIMQAALRDLTLFQTSTAARIAQFHGALRGIQNEIGDYRDNPLRWAGRLAEFNQLIKTRAAAACRAVPELMKALEQEGGTPPPHLGEPSAAAPASSEALPPPPFGAGEGDDWTL